MFYGTIYIWNQGRHGPTFHVHTVGNPNTHERVIMTAIDREDRAKARYNVIRRVCTAKFEGFDMMAETPEFDGILWEFAWDFDMDTREAADAVLAEIDFDNLMQNA